MSLRQIDEVPLYVMEFQGDYGFAEFLKTGAEDDSDIEKHVIRKILLGMDTFRLEEFNAACTVFSAVNHEGESIFARNFDFDFSPALLLYTNHPDGYASVSMVNLSYAGFNEERLPTPILNRFMLLGAPYIPFDGINEKGVSMALLSVPFTDPPYDEDKVTLNTTTVIRLVLDYAKDLDEAIFLLSQYNIYFSGGIDCHYLIADASGRSAVVEYFNGKMVVVPADQRWQTVSNFIISDPEKSGEGYCEVERFETVEQGLGAAGGILSETKAMSILKSVKIPGKTQWAVVYNQVTKEFILTMGGNYRTVYNYNLLSH
ncbi:MAG: C45 family peptidase [Bacillota bacterium]|nr:C45 family peptidase [Bacillota bacterium]